MLKKVESVGELFFEGVEAKENCEDELLNYLKNNRNVTWDDYTYELFIDGKKFGEVERTLGDF